MTIEYEDVTTEELPPYPTAEPNDNERACLVDYKLELDCPGQNGSTYDRNRLIFEIEQVDPESGRHFYISRPWPHNLGRPGAKNKGKTRTMLEGWLDRTLTADELKRFSWRPMIGFPCRLSTFSKVDDGKTYTNIDVVKPAIKGEEYLPSGDYVRPVESVEGAPF